MISQELQQKSQAGRERPAWERSSTPPGREQEHDARQPGALTGAQRGPLTFALGVFSLGLGLTQIMAPGAIARLIGIKESDDNLMVLRLVGARELTAGTGIFGQRRPVPWLWARVAGDALDLTLLGRALNARRVKRERVSAALMAVAGITALDLLDSIRLTRRAASNRDAQGGYALQVRRVITINRPPEEIYAFWRDFRNLPRFMQHLQSVQVIGDRRSHWQTRAPLGKSVAWDAEITRDEPNALIAWRSLPGADVDNAGEVRFAAAPGGRGTEVHVEMNYNPPGGAAGKIFAALFGEAPEQQVYDDLRAFKQVLETGEVIVSDATVHGHPHPAQPPADKPRAQAHA